MSVLSYIACRIMRLFTLISPNREFVCVLVLCLIELWRVHLLQVLMSLWIAEGRASNHTNSHTDGNDQLYGDI